MQSAIHLHTLSWKCPGRTWSSQMRALMQDTGKSKFSHFLKCIFDCEQYITSCLRLVQESGTNVTSVLSCVVFSVQNTTSTAKRNYISFGSHKIFNLELPGSCTKALKWCLFARILAVLQPYYVFCSVKMFQTMHNLTVLWAINHLWKIVYVVLNLPIYSYLIIAIFYMNLVISIAMVWWILINFLRVYSFLSEYKYFFEDVCNLIYSLMNLYVQSYWSVAIAWKLKLFLYLLIYFSGVVMTLPWFLHPYNFSVL